ncbi:hypothetical protein AMTR_s00206p00032630 [Amborella trichopoda]|uniref:C2 domain-containing protein n=1 Tax=Amborella trichopoda TaxID=13333 RepID=W1NZF3_AMBTC|nr:hypothetical protein AMTR_s00206p00032630 [Amborella trichopoda]
MKILEVILTLKSRQATWPKKIYTVLSVQQKNLKTKIIKTNQDDFDWTGKFVFLVEDSFLIKPDTFMTLKIYHARRLLRDELLGYARTPVTNVMVFEDWGFLSLHASGPSGVPRGLVNFSMALWPAGCATGEFLKGREGMDFYGL